MYYKKKDLAALRKSLVINLTIPLDIKTPKVIKQAKNAQILTDFDNLPKQRFNRRKLANAMKRLSRAKNSVIWHRNAHLINMFDLSWQVKGILSRKFYNGDIYTNGYIKMTEMCYRFHNQLFHRNKSISALFLAEYPGYFSQAVKHYCEQHNIALTYKVQSLDPDESNNALPISPTLIDEFHDHMIKIDGYNGDLTVPDITKYFKMFRLRKDKVSLCIADGGIPIGTRYDDQEQLHYKLFAGEIAVAINTLAEHGTFIMKTYHLTTITSFALILALRRNFSNILLYKPKTSRSRNDEKYVICTGFKANKINIRLATEALLSILNRTDEVPDDWSPFIITDDTYTTLSNASLRFIDMQCAFLHMLDLQTHGKELFKLPRKFVWNYINTYFKGV